MLPTEDVKGRETEHGEEGNASVSMTVLVMIEKLCRSGWAYAVTGKGSAEQWVIDQMIEDLDGRAEERTNRRQDRSRIINHRHSEGRRESS